MTAKEQAEELLDKLRDYLIDPYVGWSDYEEVLDFMTKAIEQAEKQGWHKGWSADHNGDQAQGFKAGLIKAEAIAKKHRRDGFMCDVHITREIRAEIEKGES